jgi:RNA polymerase sigma-70 factor (ECF subfamily)
MSNSQKKFGKIYDQYIEKIYRFIFLKVSSAEIAEDLTSETFLRGWRAFKADQDSIENHQAFLYRIARNLIVDFYRDKGKTQVISTEYVQIEDPQADLEKKAKTGSDMIMVQRALAGLKEDYQNVIIWRYLDGLPIRKVAKLLGKSEENTRTTLHRALKLLKNRVNQDIHLV